MITFARELLRLYHSDTKDKAREISTSLLYVIHVSWFWLSVKDKLVYNDILRGIVFSRVQAAYCMFTLRPNKL